MAAKRPQRGERVRKSSPRTRAGASLVAATPRTASEKPVLSVVGIGASAGGLEACTKLLRALPAKTGMAFVLVQHLAPGRESALAEILGRATPMPVTEAADRQELEANHVYVIPPDRNLEIVQGRLRLLLREAERVPHPIDFFFRSLAANLRHRAIGVVLSGTATDGTIGLEEIKSEGGFCFAQDDTALHSGMPRSAIASGCVDLVLPPEAIAAEIARIADAPYVAADRVASTPAEPDDVPEQAAERLAPILGLLHDATGVDFTEYKASTLERRIGRRMVLRQSASLADYVRSIQGDPTEIEALYKDILISVTSFFRDPEVFAALEQRFLPSLFKDRGADDPIRVWDIACSTGEEAYSLAMILAELRASLKSLTRVQIVATDINDAAIEHARAGVYSKERVHNVSRARVQRFFVEQDGVFRVSKEIRDMCRFSRHNVLSDPPFSRMDLVSCRNLLIYLEPPLQQRVVPVLHYALKSTGLLVLGESETVGSFTHLLGKEDAKCKIYRKRPSTLRVPLLPISPTRTTAPHAGDPPQTRHTGTVAGGPRTGARGITDALAESDRLLAGFAPPAVLVDANAVIVKYLGNTEKFLAPAQGLASHDLLKMARQGLAAPLRALLHKAGKEHVPASAAGLRFRSGKHHLEVDLEVIPIPGHHGHDTHSLVIFKELSTTSALSARADAGERATRRSPGAAARESTAAQIARLEHELESSREYLQAVTEQFEAANEALQVSNEEGQSANEEFQSINEELETSKEEIQSSNEELTTINDELSNRNLELAQLSSDLTNLINSVQVALVIIALDFRIRRFNPMAEKLMGIIASDVGRPLTEIRMNLVYADLFALLNEVIGTISAREREVQSEDGRWFSLRIHPYLNSASNVDGAVLSLIDITAIRRTRASAESIVATVREPLLVLDRELRVRTASRSFYSFFGVTRAETEGRLLHELGDRDWNIPELLRQLADVIPHDAILQDFLVEREFKGLGPRALLVSARTLLDPIEWQQSILLSIEDVTVRKQQAQELLQRNEDLAASDAAKNHFLAVLSHELRSPLNVIRLWSQILQKPDTSDEVLRRGLEIIDRSSKAQARLVEDLLDVHRIASGKLRLELAEIELSALIRTVVEALTPMAAEKAIRLHCQIDAARTPMSGDPTRLQQVITNVLENAIKFTPQGGEIRVSLHKVGTNAELVVTDTGEGIQAEDLDSLFESFRLADPLTSRSHGGLGLGLAIAKQLVELHGGTIAAASPGKGGGATFTISLPLLAGKLLAIASPTALPGRLKDTDVLNGILVLVVDDDPDTREALRWLLERAGARTIVVGSADAALTAFQKERPDVIVSDIGMPGLDGYQLVQAIRAFTPEQGGRVPAIALTAYAAAEDRRLAARAGFQAHLSKPLDPEKIIAGVAALATQAATPDAKPKS
jgi:two-component system CheB/CheR fusion protein